MTIKELQDKHPMPWGYVTLGGQVILQDRNGARVEMFTMLDFVCSVTNQIAAQERAGAAG